MTDGPRARSGPHQEVASYALGVLGDAEATRFEEHLVTCDACARQLEEFLPVVDLLPEVRLSPVDLPPRPIDPDADELRARRRRRASRRQAQVSVHSVLAATRAGLRRPAVAAAAAAVAAAAVTAGVVGELGSDEIATTTAAGASPTTGTPWDGLRGPDVQHGRHLEATDSATGVRAEVVLDSASWGTRVSFALSHLSGPQNCRLVAVQRDGSTQVLSSWVVPAQGYGGDSQRPLVLQAATALDTTDITALRVDSVGPAGSVPLVTVPA